MQRHHRMRPFVRSLLLALFFSVPFSLQVSKTLAEPHEPGTPPVRRPDRMQDIDPDIEAAQRVLYKRTALLYVESIMSDQMPLDILGATIRDGLIEPSPGVLPEEDDQRLAQMVLETLVTHSDRDKNLSLQGFIALSLAADWGEPRYLDMATMLMPDQVRARLEETLARTPGPISEVDLVTAVMVGLDPGGRHRALLRRRVAAPETGCFASGGAALPRAATCLIRSARALCSVDVQEADLRALSYAHTWTIHQIRRQDDIRDRALLSELASDLKNLLDQKRALMVLDEAPVITFGGHRSLLDPPFEAPPPGQPSVCSWSGPPVEVRRYGLKKLPEPGDLSD